MKTIYSVTYALLAFALPFSLPSLVTPSMTATADHTTSVAAFEAGWKKGRQTGFPIPRFVSLDARKANMRVGPSTDYPTRWVYSRRGLPLEITEEYGNWRRIRDVDGETGWMLGALLSGRRTAVIGPWVDNPAPMRSQSKKTARIIARLAPKVRLNVASCDGTWCLVELQRGARLSGYVRQASLWGVYPSETIE